jgi:hypothetical protein
MSICTRVETIVAEKSCKVIEACRLSGISVIEFQLYLVCIYDGKTPTFSCEANCTLRISSKKIRKTNIFQL